MHIPACIVMAGGRGSRLGGVVKPLLRGCRGGTILSELLDELTMLCKLVVVAASGYTIGALRGYCGLVECVYTSGLGYVEDLTAMLRVLRVRPVLVAPGDLVILEPGCVARFARHALEAKAEVVTGVSASGEPLGLSLFKGDGGDWVNITVDCALDVDTPSDALAASGLCSGQHS